MINPISHIHWKEISVDLESLSGKDAEIDIAPLNSGLEAEVYKISTSESDFVLKVWNRSSKPNISIQFKLLQDMFKQGMAVSRPIGWGMDELNNQVLLTSFDGMPIDKVNKSKLAVFANMLTDIHKLQPELLNTPVPKYDFAGYFFPGIDEHFDIKEQLSQLVTNTNIEQNQLIHGDYNLGNILESNGKYTIIDWTNVQLGDPKYDIAWSIILMRIYVSERYSSHYRSLFVTMNNYSKDELEKYEAIACLRWILLNRTQNLPKGNNTIQTVKSILRENSYLTEKLLC
ncbi:aminoglycoside phosphotransferase family protein [Paenibacillus lentus]|uniref:aminoglycoside phosphotransferase family protein n=1 Tax=Paenibacillus lentus TaxID=1338368 RepID=UPI00365B310D